MVKREPVRVPGVILFERNLLDPVLLISTCIIYLFCCIILPSDASFVTFLVIFSLLCGLFNYHLESYRSFIRIRKCVRSLELDDKPALKDFLSSHLRYLKPGHVFEHPTGGLETAFAAQQSETLENQQKALAKNDTYRWANKMINFFWPYLSHVVHHELNEFLANSRSLVRTSVGLKRLLYAFFRQVDANILAIEHCELGSNAPHIKSIHVLDEGKDDDASKRSLIYDLDLVYEGNMNISFICRYFCCCNSRLGLKDVFIHLSSRFIIGPIDSRRPSIEKFSFSLLKLPKFGYKGIALVELAELRIAKRSINRLIKEHILFPKVVSLTLEDLIENIKARQQEQAQQIVNQPGRIGSSQDNDQRTEQLPWTTRILARLMFCTCMCSNFCLRCCQEEKLNRDSQRLQRLNE